MRFIIFIRPPPFIFFIMPCICSNWLSRRLTSCTCTPAPAAMRRLRLALMQLGLAPLQRRHRVDDAFHAPHVALGAVHVGLAGLGRQLRWAACPSGWTGRPSSSSAQICARKSFEVEAVAALDLVGQLLRRLACRRPSAPARPAPRCRPCRARGRHGARRRRPPGRRSSRTMPANLIGAPVTCRTDSAAPPRESPSSLVSTTPVSGSASLKALAVLTASWPCIASTTNSVSTGLSTACRSRISSISASSIASRPAVSTSSTSK